MQGITDIFLVPDRTDPNVPIVRDFLDNYGVLSLEDVRAHAATYVVARNRQDQDSTILYHAAINSLSTAGRSKISVWEQQYTVAGMQAGVPLLKVIIRESSVDTQATAAHIREQLASLDEYMQTVQSDIKKFNLHVKELILDLRRRREQSSDILTNLFKGYKAASDRIFVAYIERKEEEYEEGLVTTPDALMTLAANKYKVRVRKGEWNAKSSEEQKILALEAKLQQIQRKAPPAKGKPGNPKDKKKGFQKDKNKDKKDPKPAWMLKKDDLATQGKSETVDDKEYWWCDALNCWCRHHPSKCRAKDPKNKGPSDKKRTKAEQALQALADDHESDSE